MSMMILGPDGPQLILAGPHMLVLGPEVEADCKALRQFAARLDNWYRPGSGAPPPGCDQRYVRYIGSVRVVFSYTEAEHEQQQRLFRHMSISVRSGLPPVLFFFKLAELLGFTGSDGQRPGDDWTVDVNEGSSDSEPYAVAMQEVDRVTVARDAKG